MTDDRLDKLIATLEELVALMRQDAEPEVPVVLGEFLPKGGQWGDSDRYRDQILHANPSPDGQAFLGDLRGFSRVAASQDVQDVQAPSAQAVTSGHGECCCGECSTGWAYWWATR